MPVWCALDGGDVARSVRVQTDGGESVVIAIAAAMVAMGHKRFARLLIGVSCGSSLRWTATQERVR
jgi:hypothetical protein